MNLNDAIILVNELFVYLDHRALLVLNELDIIHELLLLVDQDLLFVFYEE